MRPDRLNPLFAETATLPGVGPAAVRALERLEIGRVKDLLFHFPVGWRETRRAESLAGAREGERIAVPVRITAHEPARGRGPFRILADDASSDGTPGWLRTLKHPRIKTLQNPVNRGYAANNNAAARMARGEVLALLNNDLLLQPNWLPPLTAWS